jgi:serine/threonine-protein kinase
MPETTLAATPAPEPDSQAAPPPPPPGEGRDADPGASLCAVLERVKGLGRLELVAVLRADQLQRWRRGQRVPAEAYLRGAALGADAELALDLIFSELVLRRDLLGEAPSLDEYLGRFPGHAAALRRQHAVYEALRQEEEAGTHARGGPAPATAGAPPGASAWTVPAPGEGATAPAPAASLSLPGYELVGELGRGGMGLVLKGHDRHMGRDVAVKLLREDLRGQPHLVRRFLNEARVSGGLQHPGIVPVYQLGECPDRRPYFTMKVVEGRTLADLLDDRPSPRHDLPRFLTVFEQVCQTVAYAHSKGVVHRDLKPANVMVGAFGEVQVVDWGLAKVLTGAGGAAGEGAWAEPAAAADMRTGVVGTPAYMAPEQARGEVEAIDERADVFGLGGILCAVLTGQPPYTGVGVLRQAAEGDLAGASARLGSCGADAELVALCRECLAPRREGRPRDAGAVAARVAAYQAAVQGRLRQAELERAAAQARARAERRARRLTAGLAAAGLALVLLGGGGWLWHEQAQAALREKTVQAVSGALGKAEQLAEQARALPQDRLADREKAVDLWGQALDALDQADKLAADPAGAVLAERRAALRQQIEPAAEQARREAKLLADAAEQARREAKLLADLDEAQLAGATWRGGGFDMAATLRGTEKALREYGIELRDGDVAALADRLRQLPAAVFDRVMFALEDGAFKTADASLRGRLLQAVEQADGDEWRRHWRAARAQRGAEPLRRLAEDARRQPPAALGFRLLGMALRDRGAAEEAIALLRHGQRAHPTDFWIHFELANLLYRTRGPAPSRLAEAAGCYRAALAVRPQTAAVRNNLGNALYDGADLPGAIDEYRRAIAIDPNHAVARYNLANALYVNKDLRGAIEEYRQLIAIAPKQATAHNNFGMALRDSGKPSEAVNEFRLAIELDPRYAEAHYNLGLAWQNSGKLLEAINEFRLASRFAPKQPEPYHRIGDILRGADYLPGAIAAYRQAVTVAPHFAAAHCDLGHALCRQGQFAAAARSFAAAFAADAKLAANTREGHRYVAARAAARAAGQGEDAGALPDKVVVMLRRQALRWLRADLAQSAGHLATAEPEAAGAVRQALRNWQQDRDLAPVRDPEALDRLREDERQPWHQLWDDVATLLKSVEQKK